MLHSIRQSSMSTWTSRRLSKTQPLSSSSRRRLLNDSIQAFCHGEPGSMKIEPTPLNRHQSASALATNSGPLSEPLPQHLDGAAATVRGQKFPRPAP
jgi:hypothetical protein